MRLHSTWLIGACLLLASSGDARAQSATPLAHDLLERAFANRYDLDFSADIDLIMQNAGGQRRVRTFRALSKIISDRTHSIGRLTAPQYLRGMTILTIEAQGRGHDSFVYLPALDKVRRVSTAQRNDAFLGSDITYEDLERRRIRDYRLGEARVTERSGERAYAITATPQRLGARGRIEFVVAIADTAILETRHFRGGETPYRVVSMPREHMLVQAGHVLPTRMAVENSSRDTRTIVVFRNLVVNPKIDPKLFSVATLDQNRRLPGESR